MQLTKSDLLIQRALWSTQYALKHSRFVTQCAKESDALWAIASNCPYKLLFILIEVFESIRDGHNSALEIMHEMAQENKASIQLKNTNPDCRIGGPFSLKELKMRHMRARHFIRSKLKSHLDVQDLLYALFKDMHRNKYTMQIFFHAAKFCGYRIKLLIRGVKYEIKTN